MVGGASASKIAIVMGPVVVEFKDSALIIGLAVVRVTSDSDAIVGVYGVV